MKELYSTGQTTKIGERYHRNTCFILDLLNRIRDVKECQGIKDFHELKGNRNGTYSLHVTGNYCITFKWDGQDAYDLDFEDYH